MASCNKLGGLLRQSASQTRVFIKGLAKRVDEQCLKEAFSSYGEVTEVKIFGRGKFGFVNFANSKAASAAVMYMDLMKVRGRYLRVKFATHSGKGGRDFSGNEVFSKYSEVTEAKCSNAPTSTTVLNIISKHIQELSKRRDHILKLRGVLSGVKNLNLLQRELLHSQPRVVNQHDFLQKLYNEITLESVNSDQSNADAPASVPITRALSKCPLSIISKQLQDLHQKLAVICRVEELHCQGIYLDAKQQSALRSKPSVVHQLIVLKKVLEEMAWENELPSSDGGVFEDELTNPVPNLGVGPPSMHKNEEARECINLVESEPLDKHRYLLISNGCEIHCLDLKQSSDQSITGEVPLLPIIATLNLLEENLPATVGLFKWGSNAYMIGGQKLPRVLDWVDRSTWGEDPKGIKLYRALYDAHKVKPTSLLIHGLSLNDSKTSLSCFESNMGKLKKAKIWPIVEEMNGEIHVIDCLPSDLVSRGCLKRIGSHEVLDLDSGRWVEEVYPTPGVKLHIVSYLVVGNKIYALSTDGGFLLFDSRKNKWHKNSITKCKDGEDDDDEDDYDDDPDVPWRCPKNAWDILKKSKVASGVGGFPYGDVRNPLYVVIAVERFVNVHGDDDTQAVAYLVNSSGLILCFQPLILFVKGVSFMSSGRIIKVEEDKLGKKTTMCSILTGYSFESYDANVWIHVFINTFTVEELPDAADKVREVVAKGSEEWPVELEFARVDVSERNVYKSDAELDGGGDAMDWIQMQACLM